MLIHDALAILVDEHTEAEGDLSLAGDDETLDASGCVVTPGLVNAHHHLLQSAFRTLPGTRGVAMSDWLPTMAAAYARTGVDAELTGVAAAVGVAEGLLCGVTTVADHARATTRAATGTWRRPRAMTPARRVRPCPCCS